MEAGASSIFTRLAKKKFDNLKLDASNKDERFNSLIESKDNEIKALKDEGESLCEAGKLKDGEKKLEEAIKIINFTMLN